MTTEVKAMDGARHPHIVAYHQSYFANGAMTILMEFMDGGSLWDVLQRVRRQRCRVWLLHRAKLEGAAQVRRAKHSCARLAVLTWQLEEQRQWWHHLASTSCICIHNSRGACPAYLLLESSVGSITIRVCCGCLLLLSFSVTLQQHKSIPEPYLPELARQVLLGLAHLHDAARICHRDIKPSNLLLSSSGQLKISDFGVSSQLSNSMSKCLSWVGTVTYMSPERIQGHSYSFNTDVWSLGLLLLECAVGRYPYPPEGEAGPGQQQRLGFWELLEYIGEPVTLCVWLNVPGVQHAWPGAQCSALTGGQLSVFATALCLSASCVVPCTRVSGRSTSAHAAQLVAAGILGCCKCWWATMRQLGLSRCCIKNKRRKGT